jgi:hypothetical protein
MGRLTKKVRNELAEKEQNSVSTARNVSATRDPNVRLTAGVTPGASRCAKISISRAQRHAARWISAGSSKPGR